MLNLYYSELFLLFLLLFLLSTSNYYHTSSWMINGFWLDWSFSVSIYSICPFLYAGYQMYFGFSFFIFFFLKSIIIHENSVFQVFIFVWPSGWLNFYPFFLEFAFLMKLPSFLSERSIICTTCTKWRNLHGISHSRSAE